MRLSLVFSILLAYVFLKEPLSKRKIIVMLMLLVGGYLISTAGNSLQPTLGDCLIGVGALFFTLATIFSKKIIQKNSPEYFSFFRILGALCVLVPATYFLHGNVFNQTHIIFRGYILVDGVIVAALFLFLYKSIQLKSVSSFSFFNTLTPVLVALGGFYLFGETMNAVQIGGAALILFSLAVWYWKEDENDHPYEKEDSLNLENNQ